MLAALRSMTDGSWAYLMISIIILSAGFVFSWVAKKRVGKYTYFYWIGLGQIAVHVYFTFLFRKATPDEQRLKTIDRELSESVDAALRFVPCVKVIITSPLCVPRLMEKKGFRCRPSSAVTRYVTKNAVRVLGVFRCGSRRLPIDRYEVTWVKVVERRDALRTIL